MSKHLFLVATAATDGRVAELRQWYDDTHIPDLLKIPGIVGATRYDVTTIKLPQGVMPADAFTVYEIDADDPMSVMAEMGRRADSGVIRFTDALDRARTIALIASPASTRQAT